MSEKTRKKKDGHDKNKKNQAMRESVEERRAAEGEDATSEQRAEQQGSRKENEGSAAGDTEISKPAGSNNQNS